VTEPHDPPRHQDVVHLLSLDVEEYFQVEAAAGAIRPDDWDGMPQRLGPCVGRALELLAARRATATFFVLGWVARHERQVVRRIAEAGHELASHGMGHRMLGRLGPDAFRQDLLESREVLEDIGGRPVIGYRAPTFSITHETAWALDVLAEAGFRYDSSIFPVRHDRYGVPGAPAEVHRGVGPAGGSVLEIPPLTLRLAGANWPVGGGGYLRLLPIRVVGAALRRAARRRHAGMLYLHPWELDPDQPVLPMGRLARWRHRVGLGRTQAKLRWLLERFRFSAVRERLDALEASAGDARYTYGRPA
jgi:polysaccharide deacetylase family protein (PEP-CTERM system associated)